ncbi:Hypothetical protein R9X50_00215200 [Acrodontium crateriforme]|uniref:Diaminohydroxyphosphoribosylamino-pyrimidine deaminase n=1 Tax=Acrodontium crateriforme TaxID=150365 RepID=A0AAQ3R6E2_9PEZI|nr:Hypothetical protein R9X50_00215200 [Acrodontium crateriforme]
MALDAFLAVLGDEIVDVDEETFDLFSQPSSLPDLGMIDAKAASLEISIAGKDFTITQSPGLLQSNRSGGTTGAALWQSSVRIAEWILASDNVLCQHGILTSTSTVLELGSGISGVVACTLGSLVQRVVATDQPYVLKMLRENIDANLEPAKTGRKTGKSGKSHVAQIDVLSLDWEHDDVKSTLDANGMRDGVDVVVACDCIYNYASIPPFVQTSADICRLRCGETDGSAVPRPTVSVVIQQLRQAEVFQQWLETFMERFRVWRMPDMLLTNALGEASGFAVHVGILQ